MSELLQNETLNEQEAPPKREFWSELNIFEVMQIARVCHNLNKAYCQSQGDDSQVDWNDAPEWQRESAISGVKRILINLEDDVQPTPGVTHQSWYEEKILNGWTYGQVKDEVLKTHPSCLPYDELPASEKAKDYLFNQLVIELM